jgi:hypothetical protein
MTRRLRTAIACAAIGLAALAPGAQAGSAVDGTTLTPPVLPGTPCETDGRWVRCDTSNVTTYVNSPAFDLPCGTFYETGTDDRHATRWYADGLLVRRSVQAQYRATWSLSPTGDGPTVTVHGDWNWWVRFPTPGDESTQVLTSHGNGLLVIGARGEIRDTGIYLPDGTHRGRSPFSDSDLELLCELLQP